jgi:CheY-like chemotaxis protein
MEKGRILLIDDEKDFLEVMKQRLESWKYEVILANSGKEGVDAVKEKRADIVILDYMMPGKDGIATLNELRKADKAIPVIMFTAYPDARAINGTQELKVSAFIPKFSIYGDAQAALRTSLSMILKKAHKGDSDEQEKDISG